MINLALQEAVALTDEGSDFWRTPPEVWRPLVEEFDIGIDLAAEKHTSIAPCYVGPDHDDPRWRDALACDLPNLLAHSVGSLRFRGAWANPPYSRERGPLDCWVELFERAGRIVPTVALMPATFATRWAQRAVSTCHEVRLFRQRIRFLHPVTGKPASSARFDSALFIWVPHARKGSPHVGYAS